MGKGGGTSIKLRLEILLRSRATIGRPNGRARYKAVPKWLFGVGTLAKSTHTTLVSIHMGCGSRWHIYMHLHMHVESCGWSSSCILCEKVEPSVCKTLSSLVSIMWTHKHCLGMQTLHFALGLLACHVPHHAFNPPNAPSWLGFKPWHLG